MRLFNDVEGLMVAVEMEREGERFYRSVARIARSPEAVALLDALREQEMAHMRDFQRMVDEAQDANHEDAQYGEESSAYLSAIAADVVFPGGAMAGVISREFSSVGDVLAAAIRSEKDSILFYQELSERAKDEERRAIFGRILREEKQHLVELQEMMGKVGSVGL